MQNFIIFLMICFLKQDICAYACLFELSVIFNGCCGNININTANRSVFMLYGIDCIYTIKNVLYRVSVLLACEDKEKTEEIYNLAEQIKKDFYGNRIVMFAPLYLSNYCVNGCLYCPYHAKNKHIPRKKLTQEEVAKEVIALQDMGHKRLAIEAGEDPVNNPIEYILDCINTIYSIKHKNGAILPLLLMI